MTIAAHNVAFAPRTANRVRQAVVVPPASSWDPVAHQVAPQGGRSIRTLAPVQPQQTRLVLPTVARTQREGQLRNYLIGLLFGLLVLVGFGIADPEPVQASQGASTMTVQAQ